MASKTTFIKLDRNILNWRWFCDSKTLSVFIYLLVKANTKDTEYKKMVIKRGQVIVNHKCIAETTGLSIYAIKTAINNLKQTGEIEINRLSKGLLATISNYEKYQNNTNLEPNKALEMDVTNQVPTEYQDRFSSYEEYKNWKEQ